MATDIVRPNANSTNQWELFGGSGDAYERVNEEIEQPTDGNGEALRANDDDSGDIEEYEMSSISSVDEVTSITVWVWGHYTLGPQATIDIWLGGYVGVKTCTMPSAVAGWSSYTWSGLSYNQSHLDAMRIKFVAPTLGKNQLVILDCVYAIITYTEAVIGYGHDYMGVPAANIDEVNGVPTANIDNIKGV